MHFPSIEFGKQGAIHNACEAIMQMDTFLNKTMERDKYRFTLTYGADTIITTFGSSKHLELISIGHAVNVAHKLEKLVKEKKCFLGIDSECRTLANQHFYQLSPFLMPHNLKRAGEDYELWFGVEY
jgi:class 3 adenylate cyclase